MFGLILLVFLAVSVVFGTPMATGMTISGFLPMLSDASYSLSDYVTWMIAGNKNIYLAIAFFVVSGNLMTKGNLSEKVYEMFAYFLGDKKGFLPICAILTATFYGMVSGSAVAVTAAVVSLCLPILTRVGYKRDYYAALLCAAGCLGMTIPPSSVIIGMAGMTNADATVAYRYAMVIGLVMILVLIACSLLHTKKDSGNRELIMQEYKERREKGFAKVFGESIWALLMPVLILGTIFTNVLTANEAAAFSVVYTALVTVYVYKTLTWKEVWQITVDSVKNIAPLAVTLMSAIAFGNVITATGANEAVESLLSGNLATPTAFMILNVILYTITGFFMNVMYIVTPILLPAAQTLGVNIELWCAVSAAIGSLALLTPPFGLGLVIAAPMANMQIGTLFKKVVPIWLLLTLIATVFAVFPALCTWIA